MQISLRGTVAAPGTIRRLWRQAINYVAAQAPYSWTANQHQSFPPTAVDPTRALRYMTRSVTHTAGTDNTRFTGMHTYVTQQGRKRQAVVLTKAGLNRNRPTVRNRMTSFGARVPTLNQKLTGAE